MPLYQVLCDSQYDWVIAKDFHEAIDKWKKCIAAENEGEEYEPESVTLISSDEVIQ